MPTRDLSLAQQQLFLRVLAALTEHQVQFAVAGAFAFRHYTGIWRFVKDLDLFMSSDELPRALEACRRAGLKHEITDPVWLAKVKSRSGYVDFITGMSNGVFWVTPEWIGHAQTGIIFGRVPAPLLAPEELILSKIFVTRRDRFDGSDICHLIQAQGKRLDWGRLLENVGEHWEMLLWHLQLYRYVYPAAGTVPDWLWEELCRRWRLPDDGARASFRGSLIDPIMFAPDVNQDGLENLEDDLRRQRLERKVG